MTCGHINFLFTYLQYPYGLNTIDFTFPNQIIIIITTATTTNSIVSRQCSILYTGHQTFSVM